MAGPWAPAAPEWSDALHALPARSAVHAPERPRPAKRDWPHQPTGLPRPAPNDSAIALEPARPYRPGHTFGSIRYSAFCSGRLNTECAPRYDAPHRVISGPGRTSGVARTWMDGVTDGAGATSCGTGPASGPSAVKAGAAARRSSSRDTRIDS